MPAVRKPLAYNRSVPILRQNAFEFFSNSAEQTRRLGIQLGGLLETGDLLCLEGELGSGKTTLVQGIAAGWGSLDAVTSPTFVLVNVYKRADGAQLAHLDAYRLESAVEAEALDIDLLSAQGPVVVEWANKIDSVLSAERLWLNLFGIDENRRRIEVHPQGQRYEHKLEVFQEAVFGLV
ncbi:MAG: tRNA (adenosine(37)-N6)-threonylcarbamoyltransferase complex ATPase subunit type 1 TsaE [Anaerolineales bacterium]